MADDYDALIDEWGEGDVQAAFWLQQHILDEGLDGIEYMFEAREKLHRDGDDETERIIEAAMDDEY